MNRWGGYSGDELIASYALRNVGAVARLFLPLIGSVGDDRISWTEYVRRRGKPNKLDGYSEWGVISELSGTGRDEGELDFHPAPGSADQYTISVAIAVISDACGNGPHWNSIIDPVFGRGEVGYSASHLGDLWTVHSFPGQIWSDDCGVGLASPAYADSIIVSGPAALIQQLNANGLEIFRVAPNHRLPAMVL